MSDVWTGLRWVSLALAALVLSACAETEFLVHSAKRMSSIVSGPAEPGFKIGQPYQIQGVWYYPAENYQYDETGIASWYGGQFHGRRTANGEIYDMNSLTAAHRTLPMPSFVRVTNFENGRSLILKVNDRGPFARGRIIDISRRGAQLLGYQSTGTARVRVQIMADKSRVLAARMRSRKQFADAGTPITVDRLPKPEVKTETLAPPPAAAAASGAAAPSAANEIRQNLPVQVRPEGTVTASALPGVVTLKPIRKTNLFIQAGAFGHFENANKVRARLSMVGPVKVRSVLINGRDLFRVRVGPLSSVAEADRMLETVTRAGYPDARIVVD
ncbi:MAG: hypothetical protein CMM60_12255 [Rhodospirillaceae bacterium]|jgi:rare lipoprotein A|nr:hypothetical protein [Rhodospirillaceae bacterium]|tara:strand:- start:2780 stop:3766 length:987 start_codon:yes stop_codon:yes gene_type:complete